MFDEMKPSSWRIEPFQGEATRTSESAHGDTTALTKGRKKKTGSLKELYGEDNEPWIMKPAASRGLQTLHDDLELLVKEKAALGETLRERLGAQTLTLRWASGLGHIAHIKGKDTKHLSEVKTVSSSRSTILPIMLLTTPEVEAWAAAQPSTFARGKPDHSHDSPQY